MSESEELQHDQAQRWESGIGVGQVHNTRRSEQTPADHLQSTGNKAPVKLSSVPPAQLGLKVINPGSQNIRVDIVAVHGLGAIPDITWRDNKSGVEWISNPEMLPKSTPEARIMRFGYDSLWFGEEPIRTTLSTIADNLLRALQREREDDRQRPLIFIGHCFGGLVIQRALAIDKIESSFPNIFSSSVGVIFLGTPHRGTDAFSTHNALLAAIASQSDLHGGTETQVLNAMISDRGSLLGVSEDFVRACKSSDLLVTCFFEQRISNLGKIIGRSDIKQFIVSQASASIDGYPSYGLPLNHFRLNKFSNPQDGNYRDICSEIVRLYRVAITRRSTQDLAIYAREDLNNAQHQSAQALRYTQPPPPYKRQATADESTAAVGWGLEILNEDSRQCEGRGYSDSLQTRSISNRSVFTAIDPIEPQKELDAYLVWDTTQDGTVLPPNAVLLETWFFRNSGSRPWPHGCTVKWTGGDQICAEDSETPSDLNMSGASPTPPFQVAPGQQFGFTVWIKTPSSPGRFRSSFRLTSPDGEQFGHQIWCDFPVAEVGAGTESQE